MRISLVVLVVLLAVNAAAQCSTDNDCKGDRICVSGQCAAPDAPLATKNSATMLATADRLARIAQLKSELTVMRDDLNDADLAPPIIKTVAGAGLLVASVFLFSNLQGTIDCESRGLTGCGSTSGAATLTAAALVGGLALVIWGGIQLRMHVKARATLPDEINDKEVQLHLLTGE